jgi:hypothetical protein
MMMMIMTTAVAYDDDDDYKRVREEKSIKLRSETLSIQLSIIRYWFPVISKQATERRGAEQEITSEIKLFVISNATLFNLWNLNFLWISIPNPIANPIDCFYFYFSHREPLNCEL